MSKHRWQDDAFDVSVSYINQGIPNTCWSSIKHHTNLLEEDVKRNDGMLDQVTKGRHHKPVSSKHHSTRNSTSNSGGAGEGWQCTADSWQAAQAGLHCAEDVTAALDAMMIYQPLLISWLSFHCHIHARSELLQDGLIHAPRLDPCQYCQHCFPIV